MTRQEVPCAVRPLEVEDIPAIVTYWTSASSADLERMGVDPAKLPGPAVLESNLKAILATPVASTKTFYLVWQVHNRPIGFASLKDLRHGESGEMHLHMWEPAVRGRGFGPRLFCLSVCEFYKRFDLREIRCEPRAANPWPNRMLQKVGFPLVSSRVGASSELSVVCELNSYAILREVAERFLQTVG